jgi:hypothetical protein
MPKLDLNAARAARAAKRGEPMVVELGDPPQSFTLVAELPIAVTEKSAAGDVIGAMRLLLANPDEDWDKLSKLDLTYDDIMSIVEFYGTTVGESLASAQRSTNTTAQSRPISDGSTGSTSPSAVGDQNVSTPVG